MPQPLYIDYAKSVLDKRKDDLIKMPEADRIIAAEQIVTLAAQNKSLNTSGMDVSEKTKSDIAERKKQTDALRQNWQLKGFSESAIEAAEKDLTESLNNKAELETMGVDTSKPLPSNNWELGFGADPVEDLSNVLQGHYGEKVPVFRRGKDIIYIDPVEKKPVRANYGVVAGLGHAIPMIADVAGTIAAGVTGSVAGLVAKETAFSTAATSVGELVRLSIGKGLGVHDLSYDEMLFRAGRVGGEAGLFTGAAGGGLALSKATSNFFKGGIFTKAEAEKWGLSTEQADALIEQANDIAKRGGSENKIKGTLFHKTDDVNVGARQAEISQTSEHAGRFKEREATDQAGLGDALDTISRPEVSPVKNVGTVGDVAGQRVKKRVEQGKQIVAKNQAELKTQLDAIGTVQKENVGAPTRALLNEKQGVAKAAEKKKWEEVRELGGFNEKTKKFGIEVNLEGDLKQLRQILERRKSRAQTSVERKGIAGLLQSEKRDATPGKIIKGVRKDIKLSRAKTKPKPQDLADYSQELSNLKAELRTAQKNKQFGTTSTRDLSDYIGRMEENRNLQLVKQGRGDLIEKIKDAETATREFHETFNRSFVGDLTKVNDNGVPVVKSKDFVDEMLKADQTEVNQLLDVVSDHPELMNQWKEGLADAYKRKAFSEDGKFSVKASKRFITENEEVLANFFSKGDLIRFAKTGELANKVALQTKKLEKFKKHAQDRWGSGVLENTDPEGLVNFVTGGAGSWVKPSGMKVKERLSKIRFVKNMTDDYPGAWQSLKNDLKRDIKNDIFDNKTGRINPTKIANWVTDREKSEVLEEVLGSRYLKDLNIINKTTQMLSRVPKTLTGDEERKALIQAIRAGGAPPLTRRGRAFTAALTWDSKRSHRAMADALLDETTMRKVARLSEHNAYTRKFFEKAFSLGFGMPDNSETENGE